MAITIKDVAKVAGVSHTTVSRALRGSQMISAETTANIQRIAQEMGYVPNAAARNLKTKRTNVLGVIVSRIDDAFFANVIKGIEEVLQTAGFGLFLAASNKDPEREAEIVQMMSERRVDGVIICSTQVNPDHRKQFEAFGVPTVLINNQAAVNTEYTVYHNDYEGAKTMTNHLLQLGHRHIAYLGNAGGGCINNERQRGYSDALKAAGCTVEPANIVHSPTGRLAGGASSVQALLDGKSKPTAIVAFNDMVAIGALHTLRSRGWDVPHKISITGFDDVELSQFVQPSLTTFRQPMYEFGRESAEMMLNLLTDKDANGPKTIQLHGELIVR